MTDRLNRPVGQIEQVVMGLLSQRFAGLAGMLSGSHPFAVELSPQLVGGHRP